MPIKMVEPGQTSQDKAALKPEATAHTKILTPDTMLGVDTFALVRRSPDRGKGMLSLDTFALDFRRTQSFNNFSYFRDSDVNFFLGIFLSQTKS